MIDHLSLHVRDLDKSKAFYTKALAPLGYALISDYPQWKVAGFGAGRPDIWLSGKEVTQATHVVLAAESKEIVDAFYKAGLEAGGTDNGAPGYRKEYSPGYYAAFIHDFDGHNIEVVFHDATVTV
jgi:predicted lactoylglutathione lyase